MNENKLETKQLKKDNARLLLQILRIVCLIMLVTLTVFVLKNEAVSKEQLFLLIGLNTLLFCCIVGFYNTIKKSLKKVENDYESKEIKEDLNNLKNDLSSELRCLNKELTELKIQTSIQNSKIINYENMIIGFMTMQYDKESSFEQIKTSLDKNKRLDEIMKEYLNSSN